MPCIFCQCDFTPDNRDTVEHVLKQSWIEELGHQNTEMPGKWIRQGEVIRDITDRGALQVVTGKVCARCNNGWMNDLDESVGKDLLDLARAKFHPSSLDVRARFRFARWLLKTTCVHRSAWPRDLRHLPLELMRSVESPSFLPRGFIAYAALTMPGRVGLRASSMHNWVYFVEDSNYLALMPEEQRTKAAFQFDRLLIGCAWVNTFGAPRYKTLPGGCHVLHLHEATHEFHAENRRQTVERYADNTPYLTQGIQIALTCEIDNGPVGWLPAPARLGTYDLPPVGVSLSRRIR